MHAAMGTAAKKFTAVPYSNFILRQCACEDPAARGGGGAHLALLVMFMSLAMALRRLADGAGVAMGLRRSGSCHQEAFTLRRARVVAHDEMCVIS